MFSFKKPNFAVNCCLGLLLHCCCDYSSVPNKRACTFINFEKKFPPAQPYLGLHVYCF